MNGTTKCTLGGPLYVPQNIESGNMSSYLVQWYLEPSFIQPKSLGYLFRSVEVTGMPVQVSRLPVQVSGMPDGPEQATCHRA